MKLQVFAGFVLAAALAACSAGPAPGSAQRSPDASRGGSPTASPTSSTTKSPTAGTTASAAPTSATPSPTAPATPSDFVKASVPDDLEWGPSCVRHAPGERCLVPFEGIALLLSTDRGTIVLLAYENRSRTSAASRTLPAVSGRNVLCIDPGCPHGGALLPYTPGAGGGFVEFVVELRDEAGRVLAKSFPSTYPIRTA